MHNKAAAVLMQIKARRERLKPASFRSKYVIDKLQTTKSKERVALSNCQGYVAVQGVAAGDDEALCLTAGEFGRRITETSQRS